MPIITAINPRRKPRKTRKTKTPHAAQQGDKPMAKRRKRRKTAAPKTIVRYRTKKNPSRAKRALAAAKGFGAQTIAGINLGGALKGTIPLLLGALAAKFAAKKFTDGGADNESWTWKNYAFSLLGGFVTAFGAQAIFKTKPGTTQKIFEGAMLLTAYKVFINEIVPQNASMQTWFGEDDALPDYDGVGAYGQPDYYRQMYGQADMGPEAFLPAPAGIGNIYQADDDDYIQGGDGHWRPISESHRIPNAMRGGYGATQPMDPVSAQMGATEALQPPNAQLGEADESLFYSDF